MASPIFISKPKPGTSMLSIARGIQLGLLGAYRSLQNPDLWRSAYYQMALNAIALSFTIQMCLMVPNYIARFVIKGSNVFLGTGFDIESTAEGIEYFQTNILNLNVFLLTLSRFARKDLDDIFLKSLEFIDKVTHERYPQKAGQGYHANLVALPEDSIDVIQTSSVSIIENMIHVIKAVYQSSCGTLIFKRYLDSYMLNAFVFLICKLPKAGPIAINLLNFQNFNDKIGTTSAILIIGLLNTLPSHYSILCVSYFVGSSNLVHDLLLPFFSRIKLTNFEKVQWIKSREGIIFGFGLCYYYLINQFPYFGMLIYGIAEASAAYLVTKISDVPPDQANALINWNSSQLIWDREKQNAILMGVHCSSDEGFKPFPGSFVIQISKVDQLNE